MELSAKTAYMAVLKTTQLCAHAQSYVSLERCGKAFTAIVVGNHDFPLTASNFGNLTAFRAIFSHTSHNRASRDCGSTVNTTIYPKGYTQSKCVSYIVTMRW